MDREYKSALHEYVAAYMELDRISNGCSDEDEIVCVMMRFNETAVQLSDMRQARYGIFGLPDLDGMLGSHNEVSRLVLSRIRVALKRSGADIMQLEMEEAYSYAMFLQRRICL